MGNYSDAYEKMIKQEGGYKLHKVANDRGGETYAGIARKMCPHWEGWKTIDAGGIPETQLVRDFYKENYWDKVRGDELPDAIAESIFNFAVNAGTTTAIKLAQVVANVTPDGQFGPRSLAAISAIPPERFKTYYALAKIKRYAEIVNRDKSQSKFLLGWVNRTLGGL